MLLVRIVENNNIGQVRLGKGNLCPAGLGKGMGYVVYRVGFL